MRHQRKQSRLSRRFLGTLLAAMAVTLLPVLPALAASAYNVVLPNGCQIDGWNSYNSITNTASASTREDANCEKIEVKMRWQDTNNGGVWVLSSSGYLANQTVTLTKTTTTGFDYSDHNGRRNGSDWGFRLDGNL